MRIAIDTDTRKILTWRGVDLASLSMTRGDRFPLEVRFVSAGKFASLPDGATGKLMLKRPGAYAADPLAAALGWVKSGEAANTIYTFSLNLNTVELKSALVGDTLAMVLEVEWSHGQIVQTSLPLPVVVAQDYIQGSEGVPEAALPGLGTMSTQNANAVNITGGSIAGVASLEVGAAGGAADLYVGQDGKVGLGTEAPTERLTVSGHIDMLGGRVKKLGTPVDATDAATKGFVDAAISGVQTALDGKQATIASGTAAQYYRGDKTWAALDKAAVSLGNVDNTSDASKPVSVATQAALDGKQAAGSYAAASHPHAVGDVTGLQAALDAKQAAGSYAAASHPHDAATTGAAGFMSSADKAKLDGIATGATAYTHPTSDGNLHVPATGTTNSGRVLRAGATAGSLSWAALSAADVGAVSTAGGVSAIAVVAALPASPNSTTLYIVTGP
jgi:hypothetical protein